MINLVKYIKRFYNHTITYLGVEKMKKEFENVLNETKKINISALMSQSKKEEKLLEYKQRFEKELLLHMNEDEKNKFIIIKDESWKKSQEHTNDEFKSTPKRIKINAFYLQELMHTYVEHIILEIGE